MSDDKKETEPVARIETTNFTESEDLRYLVDQLNEISPYSLNFVPSPNDDEPDFYLVAEVDG